MKRYDLGEDRIGRIFLGYAVPGVIGMIAMGAAGIIDGIFIGRYVGSEALAAVNMINPLASLAIGFSIMVGAGGGALSAAELGAGKVGEARQTYTLTLLSIGILALAIVVLGIVLEEPLIRLLGARGSLFLKIREYLRGAALATGLAQSLGVLVLGIWLLGGKTAYRLVRPRVDLKKLVKMLSNGSSELIGHLSEGITIMIFNGVLLGRLGSPGVAAYSVIGYGAMIAGMFMGGISQGIQPGMSFNLGTGNIGRIRKLSVAPSRVEPVKK